MAAAPRRPRGGRRPPEGLALAAVLAAALPCHWALSSGLLRGGGAWPWRPPRSRGSGAGRGRAAARAAPWDAFAAGIFGAADPVEVPATTKAVIEALSTALEAAIKKGLTRIDIDLPPGLRLGGVEGTVDSLRLRTAEELVPERIARGDRDLARFMAILLKPMEKSLCIAFRTSAQASVAQKVWQQGGNGGRIVAYSKGGGPKRGTFADAGGEEEALAFRRSVQDSRCSHLVLVAPKAKQLGALAALDEELPKVCLVAVNARLRCLERRDALQEQVAASFNPAFHLRLVGRPGNEGLVYHTTREGRPTTPWIFATRTLQASDGASEALVAKELSRSDKEPTAAEILRVFGNAA